MSSGGMMDQEVDLLKFNSMRTIACYLQLLLYLLLSVANVFNILGDAYGSIDILNRKMTTGTISLDYPICFGLLKLSKLEFKVNVGFIYRSSSGFSIELEVQSLRVDLHLPHCHFDPVSFHGAPPVKIDLPSSSSRSHFLDGLFDLCGRYLLSLGVRILLTKVCCNIDDEMSVAINNTTLELSFSNTFSKGASYRLMSTDCEIRCLGDTSSVGPPPCAALSLTGLRVHYNSRMMGDDEQQQQQSINIDVSLDHCSVALSRESLAVVVGCITKWSSTSLQAALRKRSSLSHWRELITQLAAHVNKIDDDLLQHRLNAAAVDPQDLTTATEEEDNDDDDDDDHSCRYHTPLEFTHPASKCIFTAAVTIRALHVALIDSHETKQCQVFRLSDIKLAHMEHPAGVTAAYDHPSVHTDPAITDREATLSIQSADSCVIRDCDLLQLSGDWVSLSCQQQQVYHKMHPSSDAAWLSVGVLVSRRLVETDRLVHDSCIRNETTIHIMDISVKLLPTMLPLHLSSLTLLLSASSELSRALQPLACLRALTRLQQTLLGDAVSVNAQCSSTILGSLDVAAVTSVEVEIRLPRSVTRGDLMASRGAVGLRLSLLGMQSLPADHNQPNTAELMVDQVLLTEVHHHHHHHHGDSEGPVDEDASTYSSYEDEGSVLERLRGSHRTILHIGKLSLQMKSISPLNTSTVIYRPSPLDVYRSSFLWRPLSSPTEAHDPWRQGAKDAVVDELFGGPQNDNNNQSSQSIAMGSCSITADQCQLISIGVIVGAIVSSLSSDLQRSGAAASSGPSSYHSIRCIHPSTSSPLEATSRSITIEDISVELVWRELASASSVTSSSPQRSRRSYKLLRSNRVELMQRSLGRVHSSAQLFLGGDLSVSSMDGDIGAEEHVRLKRSSSLAGPISDDFDSRGVKLWSSKQLPCEVHLRSNPSHHRYRSSSADSAPVGVELVAEYAEYTLPHLCITWDCTHFDDLCSLINCYRTSSTIGTSFASEVMGKMITASASMGNAPEVDQQQHQPSRDSAVTDTHHTTSQPTRITAISLESISIQMKHLLKPVLCLLSKSARISSLSFGPHLRQLNLLVQSIALHELTTSYAVHTCLLGDVDPNYPSRLELHSTSLADEFTLLEFQVDNMRIFYLHRAIFTVCSFLIDHCIPSTRSHLIGCVDGLTGSYLGGHSSGWSPPTPPPPPPPAHCRRGMLRVGGCFSCSELHLPLNSCSTDALVLIINEWKIYRSCPTILDQSSSYCMGPHLDRGVWIGQMKSSRVLMQQLFSEKRGSPPCSPPVDVHWTLPQQAKLLLIPPAAVTAQGASPPFGLSFSVKKSLLCSWCSANAISEDFTITGTYSLVPSSIIADTTSSTCTSTSSPPSALRNTISVDISADEIEWILSQGQYSAIIALIQQNFCELQEHVVPEYVLPPPRLVPLTEHVFGRYALDLRLPILSTVPVHIKKGKVVAIENSPDYYDLFCSPLPFKAGQERYLATGSFADTTIPECSYHADHRRALFAHVISERVKRRVSRSRHFEADPPIEPQYYSSQAQMYTDLDGEGAETTVLSIIFQAMELDFYRRHDNGGNGIEISCQSFVVCSSESDGVVDDDGLSINSNHDNEMSIGSIMFAPTSFPLLNSALNRGNSNPGKGVVDPSSKCAVPHITYSQQGTGNLRRCIINIQDSVAVANMAKVLHGVEYFLKPIHLNGFRNVHIVETRGLLDYLVCLDCEVHVKNTIVCFSSTSHRGEENALCVQVDLDYMQAWRGFLVSGPGKISLNIDVSVTNVYIAPMREINPSNVKSLVNPFVVVVAEKKLVVPEASQLLCNLERLSRFMSLGDWIHRENRLSSPVTYLSLNMRVTPSRLAKESPEASPAMDGVLGGDSGIDDVDGDGDGDGEDVDRDSLDEYDYSNTGYVDVKEASAMRIIVSLKDILFMAEAANQIRAGLQNRLFIVANRRDLSHMIKAMRQDVQHLPPLSHYLVHTPFPSLIINTDTNNELISEICNFEVLLRNNTYNLDILKMNSYSNSMMYIRSADQLQLESGSSCALWAYNESVEEWEPLVEPTNLRAVAAENKNAVLLGPSSYEDSSSSSSSSSAGTSSSAESMSAKFRIDVMSDPIDVNVSQNALANLVSKLSLPDVVTTSSVLLPPYKVINELGCELRFAIRMGGSCIHSNTLSMGKSIPIEVYQLSEALDSFKQKRKFANTRGDATMTEDSDMFTEGKQYRIEISFLNRDGILFRSKSAVPMDKVGMHRFEMVAAYGPGDRRKSFIGSKPHPPSIDCDEAAAALSLSTAGKKALSFASVDIPLVLLDMQIKDDGIRELLLRSIVSLRNNTSQIFQLSVRLDGASTELSLAPNKEWFLPISFAHPKTALFCRIDEQTDEWLEMLPSLQAVITHGYWGVPSKLQAFLCSFDRNTSEVTLQETTKACSPTIVLVKPECKFGRSHLRSAESGGSFVSVKYPSTDASSVSSVVSNVESSVLSNVSRIRNIGGKYQPLCIHLLAPLQLCNLITQPLLYRIADAQGVISSEGILLSGELVDVYNLINLFTSKIFISVRMLNYSWSKWVVCFHRGNPYPTGERSVDLSLQSMTFSYDEELLVLPTLDLLMVAKEYLVRFVCPVIISNRTGMQLDLSGPNPSNESFIPYPSKTSVESLLPSMSAASTSTTLRPTIVAEKEIDSPVGKSKTCVHRRTYRTAQSSRRVSLDESDSDRSSQDIVALDRNSFSDSDSDYRSGASSIDSSAVDKLSKGHTCDDLHIHLNIPNDFGVDDDDNCDDEEEKKKTTAVCEGEEVRGDLMDEFKAAMLGISSSRRGGGGGVSSSGMRSVVSITTGGHSTSSMRVSPIVVLTIHLPFDHLRSIEVIASSEWTLSDVFTRVKQYLAVLPNNQLEINYVFQYFEYSRIEADSIENSLLAIDFSSSDLRAPLDETDTTLQQQDQLTTSNRNHHPTMASSSPSKEKRQSISLKNAVTKKNEIPIGMRYNMLLGCSLIPLMASTKVMELRNHRLRICHQTEWEIFVQSSSIRIEEVVTDGLFSSLFSRSKVTYIAIFMKYTGDIPLRSRTMLGHNSSFSIRVPGVSQWSDAIDILKVDTSGSSESCIVLSEASEDSGRLEFYYEFGAHVEKSAGFLHGITSVTIVPKHILVSKLSMPIEIAQLSSSEDALLLSPGLVTCFHYPRRNLTKLLQIRRVLSPMAEGCGGDADANVFIGEIDISRIGVVYAKLRNPALILKVQVESVGASLVATFWEQTSLWPPYRIDNLTESTIRFRQVVAKAVGTTSSLRESDNTSSSSIADDSVRDKGASRIIPWDNAHPRSRVPFAWDLPMSCRKSVQVEVEQVGKWIPFCEVPFDADPDDFHPLPMVINKRAPSSQGNPFAEGFLSLCERDSRTNQDSWSSVYCILRPGVLYVYPDDSRTFLKDVIRMDTPGEGEAPQFATVKKLLHKRSKLTGFFSSSTSATLGSTTYDSNQVRVLILKIADKLDLYQDLSPDKMGVMSRRKRADSDQEGEEKGKQLPTVRTDAAADDAQINVTSEVNRSGASPVRFLFGGVEEGINKALPTAAAAGDDGDGDGLLGSTECKKRNTLRTFLSEGVSAEDLLNEISSVPVHLDDVVEAIMAIMQFDLRRAVGLERAQEVCDWLLSQGFLAPRSETIVSRVQPVIEEVEEEEEAEGGLGYISTGIDVNFCDVDLSLNRKASTSDVTGRLTMHARPPPSRNRDLRGLYEGVDLYFCPPSLSPELLAALSETSAGATSEGTDSDVQAGFTIELNKKKHSFKCSSKVEFLGWIQACRQCIERSWVDYFLGRRTDKSGESLEDYQHTVLLKLRADGSTRVLEIIQSDLVLQKSSVNKRKSIKGIRANATAKALNRLRTINSSTVSELGNDEDFIFDREKQLVSALFNVQSIALSVINAEPSELLYLSFHDIEMRADRSIDLVKFSVTVDEIQTSDQLLSPGFPVALYARKMHQGTKRLLLPGLNPDRCGYPSLHFYIQQRYHQSMTVEADKLDPADATGMVPDSNEADVSGSHNDAQKHEEATNLFYFEIFTLWIAPLQLNLDEEILVKSLRFMQGLRDYTTDRRMNLSQHSSSSPDQTQTSSMFSSSRTSRPTSLGISDGSSASSTSILSTKYWESQQRDRQAVAAFFSRFVSSGKIPYLVYNSLQKGDAQLYFSLLQLHPLDVSLSFKPSPDLVVNTAELALISILAQLDSAHLRLNAIIAEHLYGSPAFLADFFVKRYRANFWKQFYNFIGALDSKDESESSALVANLGSGVYDLNYEPIEGLTEEGGLNSTALGSIISKGGKSLAARSIGGTSAIASHITGGIGKGVSILTLDSEFQRHRSLRRYNKATSVSEGLYVGTQELGKNIVEGFTGIVVSPYRGYETGGMSGFGMGIAKGLLGVALKPAVGVLDLASRATEGLKNSALNIDSELRDGVVHRKRIPRPFGRNRQLTVYDERSAAAQYVADTLTMFKQEPRLHVVHHLHVLRCIITEMTVKPFSRDGLKDDDRDSANRQGEDVHQSSVTAHPSTESWGYPINSSYLILVTPKQIALIELMNVMTPPLDRDKSKRTVSISTSSSRRKASNKSCKFIWTCPAEFIDQLFSDSKGDLIISLNSSVLISGPWNSTCPVILDRTAQNYLIFQSLLEQTLGLQLARLQPLQPLYGLTQHSVRKRYSSGLKSYLMLSPTLHTYRLFGHVLYEYTLSVKSQSTSKTQLLSNNNHHPNAAASSDSNPDQITKTMPVAAADSKAMPHEEYIENRINKIFSSTPVSAASTDAFDDDVADHSASTASKSSTDGPMGADMFLSFVYPLVDLLVSGPLSEDGGKVFSITVQRKDGQKMRVLRCEDCNDQLTEYFKVNLTLMFTALEDAMSWKHNLQRQIIAMRPDVIPLAPLTFEDKRKSSRSILGRPSSSSQNGPCLSADNSILSFLVLPTASNNPELAENVKIEIAKTLSALQH